MLASLTLENFQKHEFFTLDFDEFVTVLIGPSDVGKSAVIRALRWLCLNQPAGDAFITHGEDNTSVTLTFDECEVSRQRGKVGNLYTLDGEELRAFGQSSVPDKIAALLNITSDNFQRQHDSPFWFTLSPGQVSKELNRVVDLDIVDTTLANIASELRKAKATLEISEERLKTASEKKAQLKWVPGFVSAVKSLEAKQIQLATVSANALKIDTMLVKWGQLVSSKNNAANAIVALSDVYNKLQSYVTTLDRLTRLTQTLQAVERLRHLADLEMPETDLVEKVDELKAVDLKCRQVKFLLEEIRTWSDHRSTIQVEINDLEKQRKMMTKGKCPVCGK